MYYAAYMSRNNVYLFNIADRTLPTLQVDPIVRFIQQKLALKTHSPQSSRSEKNILFLVWASAKEKKNNFHTADIKQQMLILNNTIQIKVYINVYTKD